MDQEHSSAIMGFWQHLDELKGRVMKCLYVFLAGFLLCYFYTNKVVFAFLQKPLFDALPPDQHKLYFTSLFENFFTHLKIAGYSALFLFSPFYFYQLWSFIAPGLHPRERRLVVPFIAAATFFFIGGAAFAYFVLFPIGFKFFVSYGLPTDMPLLTIDSYYGTCLKLMLLFGSAFELPVLMILLGFLGLLSAETLRAQRKNAFLGITIVSAFIAPPDAVSMLLLMAPLMVMYEGATFVVGIIEKRRAPRDPAVSHPEEDYDPFVGKSRP
jgi:sec-independent protein translocase protein TatC